MKPVILITLHRRYEDLIRSLETINERKHEFGQEPAVGIVWADPELDREWWIDELFEKYENLEFCLLRSKLEFEGEQGGTTFPESHNITYGLRLVRDLYDDAYAIVQATDCTPQRDAYGEIHRLISEENHNAVVYYWHNTCLNVAAFCTYFFAVKLEEKFWPPLCTIQDSHESLEVAWLKISQGRSNFKDKELWGYAAFPPNRRLIVENLPLGSLEIQYRNKNNVGMFISGKAETKGIIYWGKQGWYWLQFWGNRVSQSFKRSLRCCLPPYKTK